MAPREKSGRFVSSKLIMPDDDVSLEIMQLTYLNFFIR